MAQQDTGLGWSAKDNWLLYQSATKVAEIGEFRWKTGVSPNPPAIPKTAANRQEIENAGYKIAESATYELYVGASTETCLICDRGTTPYPANWILCGVSVDQNALIYLYIKQKGTSGGFLYTLTCSTRTGSYYTGGYSGVYSLMGGTLTSTRVIPIFATADDAANNVEIAGDGFYKTNIGYAVGCVAKWYTKNDVLITTPILISNKTENVDMTSDSSAYSLAKLNIRYDGMMFYMSFFDIVDKNVTTSYEYADLSMFNLDLDQVFKLIAQEGMSNILVNETVDPYEDFGYTEEDAGEINPDPQDDEIDFDDLPTKSFATAGFCRIFNPDVSDLNDLASYMWTDQNFLQTVINHLKQILENPIEAIIPLSMVPVQPPVGSSKVPVNVMFINTGVSMRPVTSQFVTVDCGTTVLQECYGGALDYNPYTRVQIYLPYIGTVQLDTDEVMAKTLHLQYHIDVVTGICCAEIKADNKLLYSFSGHCAVSQPITSADFSSYLNAAVAAAKVAVGVATGMASTTAGAAAAELPPAVPSKAQTSSALVPLQSSGPIGPHLGSPGLSGSRGWTDFSDIPEPQSSGSTVWGELAKPGNVNTVASAMGGKMVVQHSGGFSGNSGYLAKRRPYLIVIRPRIANPRNYAQHFGRTSMEYLNLGSCTGYTKVQSVHLSGFDATNPELSEISSLLKGGVLM